MENKFEENIKKLDEIVKQLEKGDVALDEMLTLFEKGINLSKICNKQLTQAEGKINKLINKDGKMEEEVFESMNEV